MQDGSRALGATFDFSGVYVCSGMGNEAQIRVAKSWAPVHSFQGHDDQVCLLSAARCLVEMFTDSKILQVTGVIMSKEAHVVATASLDGIVRVFA